MTNIPFDLIGTLGGHLLMGYQLSLVSIMGMVALVGVIVNSGLFLIAFANQRRVRGESAFEAIKSAAVRRFQPILLTSVTTFGGLVSMIFGTSERAQLMVLIVISLGYGVLFATVTTLLTTPALYLVNEDVRRWFKRG